MTTDFRALQAKNRRTTWMLLFASFLLLTLVSLTIALVAVGGIIAAVFALVFSFGTTFASYRASDTIALRSNRAQPADPPKPRVYVVDDPAPNAFATGKDPEHAAIAATTGLIAKLDRAELQGVIAHEMAHIRNNDIRVMTVAVATAGAIALIADIFWRLLYFGGMRGRGRSRDDNGAQAIIAIVGFLFVAVLAPLAASLLKAAISRSREGLADASAVELTRHPEGLRSALEKLDADVTVVRRTSHATSHLWIEAPDDHERDHKGRRFNDMFNTHPPLRERIDALRKMEGLSPYEGPTDQQLAEVRSVDAQLASAQATQTMTRPGSWADLAATASLTELADTHTDEPADQAAPGWYGDPTSQHRLRWWDGHAWTSFTSR
jgi:heat shock protein HtpX